MRALAALLVLQLLALGAAAQSDTAAARPAAEFGHASSGSIDAITKGSSRFSGSLSLSRSAFGGTGYGATLGGEVLKDHLWVFAAASVLPRIQFSNAELPALDAKATAQPVDWAAVTASFTRLRQPLALDGSLPSSFLSLRSTTLLSERMMLNISFSKTTATP